MSILPLAASMGVGGAAVIGGVYGLKYADKKFQIKHDM